MPAGVRPCDTCEQHAHHVAEVCEQAGEALGVDPWLLAALTYRESRWDPERVSRTGDSGIAQLNPRSRWGRRARALCSLRPEDCDLFQVVEAAALLRTERARCGSWRGALSAYHRGRCQGGESYAARVLRMKGKLKAGKK